MAGHSPSGFSDRVQNAWFHQLWQVNPGPEAAKQPQTITLHHHVIDCRYECSFMKCCVGFISDVTGHTPYKKFNSEACRSLDVVLGSFMTSWMSRHCALGVILVGRPLLGRFTTVTSFLHLWIMALTVVHWSPKALEMAL